MKRLKKLEELDVPEGMTPAEYLAQRLNEAGGMERLAVELGWSYATLYNTCQELGIVKQSRYVVAEAERVAS